MGQTNQAIIAEIIEDFNKIYPNIVVSQYSQGYNNVQNAKQFQLVSLRLLKLILTT